MRVTGFSFIKDAIKFDYPIVEAIQSILPLCDKFVVAVGRSSDETLELIKKINPDKISILETEWDESLREGGRVLAEETNKAFQAVDNDSDWAIYIQGDEVIHEKYLEIIKSNMLKYKDDIRVDGLLLHYLHFYGSYDYVGSSERWYKNEIRVIKNNKAIYSFADAQGFRKDDNKMLNVIPIDAYVYHYGWVKEPKAMQNKQENFHKYWHDDNWVEINIAKAEEFDYTNIDSLAIFDGTHPKVMEERIKSKNWQFDYDISMNKHSIKDAIKKLLRKYLNINANYQNYKIIK